MSISEEGWARIKAKWKNQPEIGVEFEGPLGKFWLLDEVPTKYLVRGLKDIIEVLDQRQKMPLPKGTHPDYHSSEQRSKQKEIVS